MLNNAKKKIKRDTTHHIRDISDRRNPFREVFQAKNSM